MPRKKTKKKPPPPPPDDLTQPGYKIRRAADTTKAKWSPFAVQLDIALKRLGLIRRQLSERCGVPLGTINAWFNPGVGAPGFESVIAVSEALNVSLDYLAGREPIDQSKAAHEAVADAAVRNLIERLQQSLAS